MIDLCILGFARNNILLRLLGSLKKIDQPSSLKKHICLVDNGSPRVKEEVIDKVKFDNLTFVYKLLDKNYGVAKGWNEMIKLGTSPVICMFNDDYVLNESISEKLLDEGFFTIYNYLMKNPLQILSLPGSKASSSFIPYTNFIINGGRRHTGNFRLFAFTRELWNRLKGFDERYFYAYEDTDFCMRCLQIGGNLIEFDLPFVFCSHLQHYDAQRKSLQEKGQRIGGSIFHSKFPHGV